MADLDWGAVERCLSHKLGCVRAEGRRHPKYKLFEGNRLIAVTGMSRGKGNPSDYLISAMARQLKVRRATFVGAVRCTVSRAELVAECQANA